MQELIFCNALLALQQTQPATSYWYKAYIAESLLEVLSAHNPAPSKAYTLFLKVGECFYTCMEISCSSQRCVFWPDQFA